MLEDENVSLKSRVDALHHRVQELEVENSSLREITSTTKKPTNDFVFDPMNFTSGNMFDYGSQGKIATGVALFALLFMAMFYIPASPWFRQLPGHNQFTQGDTRKILGVDALKDKYTYENGFGLDDAAEDPPDKLYPCGPLRYGYVYCGYVPEADKALSVSGEDLRHS